MTLRIGYYDDSIRLGGTTRYLLDIISGLNRGCYTPLFFAPAGHAWHEELRRLDVKVCTPGKQEASEVINGLPSVPIQKRRWTGFSLPPSVAWHLGLAGELNRAYALFRSEYVDFFHSNNVGAEPGPIAARWTGKPVVGTLHVDPTYDLLGERGSFRYRQLEKWCFRSLDAAIAVSQRTRDEWITRCGLNESYISKRMAVVHNGIDAVNMTRKRSPEEAKRAFGLGAEDFVIVSLGRLEAAKGYEFLIRALPRIHRTVPAAHIVIGGKGVLEGDLKSLAQALGVAGYVHFPGFVSEVREVLEAGDVYVQPSLCEALPYSVLEACSIGLPAVVADVGGMAEIVVNMVGFVVPPASPELLCQSICQLASNSGLRLQYAARARERVLRNFSIGQMREQTFEVYDRVTKCHANGNALARSAGR